MKIFLTILCLLALAPVAARAQNDPPGRPQLTKETVRAELEWRLRRDPSYATVWNTGYDLYRLHLRNQDTAMAIFQGFMAVRGNNPEQSKAIRQAAVYWRKVHDYGITNVPVGLDTNLRGNIFWGDSSYSSTLGMRRPKGGAVPLRKNYSSLKKRSPLKGRANNPYPGNYYPGVYPP